MLLPSKQQNLSKGRADFNIVEFRKLIQQKGLVITWQQTLDCPCSEQTATSYGLDLINVDDINSDRGGRRADCPVCGGLGVVRHSSQDIKALCTNASGDEEVGNYGLLKRESIKFTLEPEHLPSYGDRFTLKNSVIVWRETVKMPAVGDTLTTSRPVVSRSLGLETGDVTVGVLYVQQTDANGQALAINIPQADITITAGGLIQFTNAVNRPAAGTNVSVAYYANPVYVVAEYPRTFRDTFVRTNNQEVFAPMLVQCEAKMEIAN